MTPSTRAAIEASCGSIASLQPVSGGSINDAFRVDLAGDEAVFVKENRAAAGSMFATEARGLAWLREAGCLRIPEVLIQTESFLVLEWIDEGPRRGDFDELLGRGLARLHKHGAPCFGLDYDNFIGSLPQANAPLETWADFYWVRRIEPQMRAARDRGLLSAKDCEELAELGARMSELLGPPEPPARLHGDLWGGNLHCDDRGEPCLIDPAVFGGHREVDLAMMQLFGGFGSRVFAAYDEEWPLDSQWRERTPIYQLYYLLVHVNLFGSGYVSQSRAAWRRYR